MSVNLEKLIQLAYKKWQQSISRTDKEHPDEEALACFLEGKSSEEESDQIKEHIIGCPDCTERVALAIKLAKVQDMDVPLELITHAKNLITVENKLSILEIILKLKENMLEILNTTGDILVGQEFMPAPVLRSRRIKDFKDEVTILKDFMDLRVELKIENKAGKNFNVVVMVKQKQTHEILKDLRVTLIRDDLELESYVGDSGTVIFEHVLAGKYMVAISNIEKKLASVILDVRA